MSDATTDDSEAPVPATMGPQRGGTESGAVRANRALELRMSGATYTQIATALGFTNRGSAHRAVKRALALDYERTADLRAEYRRIQAARLERLIRGVWTIAVTPPRNPDDGPYAQLAAVDRITRLLDRQAKLLGLDAPTEVIVAEATMAEVDLLVADLESMLNGSPNGEVIEVTADGDGG